MQPHAPHRARVTDIGEYIRHRSCQRRFRLADGRGALYRALPFADRPYHLIDPILIEAGRQRERAWAESLRGAGLRELSDPERDSTPLGELLPALAALPPGVDAFAREVAITGEIGAFALSGQIDLLLLLWRDGRPVLRLIECKASRRDRTYHRVQVALYRRLVAAQLAVHPLLIDGHHLAPHDVEAVVVRIDQDTGRSQSILDAAPFTELDAINHDLGELLALGGALDRSLTEPLEELPFQLDDKCDDCAYSAHCFAESARQRRLELIGVAPACARALRSAGVPDLDALAQLDRASPAADRLAAHPDLGDSLEGLQVLARARRATLPGGRTEHPIHPRPFAGRGHLPAHEHQGGRLLRVFLSISYDYVDDRIGALSAHITRSDGELCTPYTRGEDGRPLPSAGVAEEAVSYRDSRTPAPEADADPYRRVIEARELQGADLVRFQTVPWSGVYERDNGLELQLLQGFMRQLVEAIADVAESPTAPIHFYVWSRAEMRRLLEAASRVGSGLLGHLRQLFGCRESLEQLIYSCLQEEIHGRYALGWTSRGLTVATALSWYGQRFHWRRRVGYRREEVDLGRAFYRDIFDFRDRLAFHQSDPQRRWARDDERGRPDVVDHRFEVRARSFDNLTAPYWRAYWGTLPSADELEGRAAGLAEALRDYGRASRPGVLEAYLLARAHALRWLEERQRFKNTSIAKPPIDLATLPTFELRTHHVGDAARDFLRLDHHVKAQDWLRAHLTPPVLRVSQGSSLPIAGLTLAGDKGESILARIDPTLAPGGLAALRARYPRAEGDFARITPRPADPGEGPTYNDLIYRGRTAIIKRLDWSNGELELALIPKFERKGEPDPYILPSFPFRPADPDPRDHPFALATLDDSLSDFIAGRVERRLTSAPKRPMRGRHVLTWLDPTDPRPPPSPPLSPEARAPLAAFLASLRFGPELKHNLDTERIDAVLGGLEARIQLLQGPPGTGKTTTTSIALLTRILAQRRVGEIVLVAAHTHTAVDTLLARVVEQGAEFKRQAAAHGLKMPRIGARKITSGNVEDTDDPPLSRVESLSVKGAITKVKDLCRLGVPILGGTVGALLKLADELNKSADYKQLPDGFSSPLLIVDEASMMVFPHFLALASLVRGDGAIMVAGDHRQLAPIVAHDWESEDRPPTVLYKPYVSAYDAIWSLRAHPRAAAAIRIDQLTHTHRLPPIIRALIQPLYIRDGIFLEGPPDADDLPSEPDDRAGDPSDDPWGVLWRCGHRLMLVVHDEADSGQQNPLEAAIIQQLLDAAPPLPERSVALVTPHRAQRALLRERLGERPEVDLIDTVERLQGGERPIIIFSATESDPLAIAKRVEFILDLNRSNVAFSRTQQRLVVVCARALLDYIPPEVEHYAAALLWKHLRGLCRERLASTTLDGVPITLRVPSR